MSDGAAPHPGTVSCDQLMALTDYAREGDLKRALDDQRIRYFIGKGGKPWTTLDLINAAAGLVNSQPDPTKLGSEIL